MKYVSIILAMIFFQCVFSQSVKSTQSTKSVMQTVEGRENELLNDLVAAYVIENNRDSAIALHLLNNGIKQALPLILDKGDIVSASTLLAAMPASEYKSIMEMQISYWNHPHKLKAINSADSTMLQSIANGTSSSYRTAQSLLSYRYGMVYEKDIPESMPAMAARKAKKPLYFDKILPDYLISIVPNPATNYLEVNLFGKDIGTANRVIIYNLLGKEVVNTGKVAGNCTHKLNIGHLPSGIYVVKAISNGTIVLEEKLTVIK